VEMGIGAGMKMKEEGKGLGVEKGNGVEKWE
jgi:hypothetical protein